MNLLKPLLALSSLFPLLGVNAHKQMSSPYPLRSPLDPAQTNPDYDNTAPLNKDGSSFFCKQYQLDDNSKTVKATYTAGQSYSISITGGAPHNGGSCQISISYDNGQSFKVLKSIIGGCPLQPSYDFTIPSFAPSSDSALLGWTWFNTIGNREMYMNCARVKVQSQSVQRYRRGVSTRASRINDLPNIFTCNIGNGCTTIEKTQIVFPDPGDNVVYGTDSVAVAPGPGYVGGSANPTLPVGSTVSSAATSPTQATSTMAQPSTSGRPGVFATGASSMNSILPVQNATQINPVASTSTLITNQTLSSVTSIPTVAQTSTIPASRFTPVVVSSQNSQVIVNPAATSTQNNPVIAPSSYPSLAATCTVGDLRCNSPKTFSMCGPLNTYINMGSVAPGTLCLFPFQIVRDPTGP